MPKQIIPVTGLSDAGLIADTPPVTLPPNAFSDCNNVRFRNGSVSKVRGLIDIFPFVRMAHRDILKYVAWWPNPNLARFNMGYYVLVVQQGTRDEVYLLKVDELGTADNLVHLEPSNTQICKSPTAGFSTDGNWQHTFFQGGFALILNNGIEAPHYILDDLDNVVSTDIDELAELPNWTSYAVDSVNVSSVTAGVIRSFGDFLIAGNLVERSADGTVVRALPGVIRTSDIAAPGSIPQNWNPFETGANTADEFTLTADGVVQDLVELQGKMFAYSNSSISSISRTGNPAGPFSISTVTPVYGAITTDSVIEFDGRHFVVGAQDIYIFGGHPGSIQSVGDGRVRDFFYDDLNLVDLSQLFVLRYQQQDEIWVCYPSQSAIQGRADKALVFNYRTNVWSKRDIPNVFNGVIGPVPGGGLPMASLQFDGEAKVSSVITGKTHEVTINNLVDIPMQGDGRPYIETLDLSGIGSDADTGGDPSIRVTLLEDFYTGVDRPLRAIIRALNLTDEHDILAEIYVELPPDLGNNPSSGTYVPYNSIEYRNTVLNPIILHLRDNPAAIDGLISFSSVVEEGLDNISFDVTFHSDLIPGDDISPVVSIIDDVSIDREYNLLSPEDRPQTGGAQDATIDRIGHSIDADLDTAVLAEYPNNTVFEFDFTDIWDRLDEFVFFFKGERTGFIDFNNRFDPLEDGITEVVAGILMTGETEQAVDGGDIDGVGTAMDGGTIGGTVSDGNARVNSDFSGGIEFETYILGSRIRELVEMSDVQGNRRLDLLANKDDVTYLNLMAYMIPGKSDGIPDYAFSHANSGVLNLNFWNARFDKNANTWVKDSKLEPISVILSHADSSSINQNESFCIAIANALNNANIFTGVATSETVKIQSVVNGGYILEWDIDNLFYPDEVLVPSEDIISVTADYQQGLPAFRNTAGTLVTPCIQLRHTDPDGIEFFSFDTGLIDLRADGNSTLTVAQQRQLITDRLDEIAPGQWRLGGVDFDKWVSSAVLYNQEGGDTGVPYPESDGTYQFPAERNGSFWTIEYVDWTRPATAVYPTTSIVQQGNYEMVTPGSFLAMRMSNDVVYVVPISGSDLAKSLSIEIESRLPQLNVILTNSDAGISIQPGVLGDDTIFMVEAYFNTTDTIEDFNRLTNPVNFTQDPLNVSFSANLPDVVLTNEVFEFPSVDGGPVIVNSVVTTEFDVDRTWSADQVDFSYEFPIFSGGMEFPNGSNTNGAVAAEIGWSYPSYSLAGTSYFPYESFVERKQMAMSPEFDTEQLQSVALWASGSTPVQFQGASRYNVLEFSASSTDNPGQSTDLSNPQQANTFYISENYKMDIRLTGRFLNWRLSDSVSGPLESPGDKTFSQQTEWNLSGMQLSVRTGGSR